MTQKSEGRVPPPERCVRMIDLVSRAGGSWTRTAAAERTEYAVPTSAGAELRAYLRERAVVAGEERFMARLPAGRVYGAGMVLSADGAELARDVSDDLGKPFERHWLLCFGKMRVPARLDGVTAVAAVNLGAGYCHWLLEELPRLLRIAPGEADHLITHATGRFAREALAARGGAERVLAARRGAHWAAGTLLVPSLTDVSGAPTRGTVEQLRAFVEERGPGRAAAGCGERIYLTREKARRRRVANEAAVWEALAARGFVKVALEDLSWAEQIAACRAARVVVAPHGAGLANLVFCEAGTRVVELVNRAYFNPVFWRLAALRGLDYRAVVSEGDGPIREEASEGGADFAVDVAKVRTELNR